jgi:hypothetical protein
MTTARVRIGVLAALAYAAGATLSFNFSPSPAWPMR